MTRTRNPELWRRGVSITLSADVLRRLDIASAAKGLTRSRMIERLLDAALPPAKKSTEGEKKTTKPLDRG